MYSEEKKEANSPYSPENKSNTSYRSTHSSRSSVLERAREYNRRIESQEEQRRRSKSLERSEASGSSYSSYQRSQSAGRVRHNSVQNRAMEQIRRDSASRQSDVSSRQRRSTIQTSNRSVNSSQRSVQTRPSANRIVSNRSVASRQSSNNKFTNQPQAQQEPQPEQENAVVTPELLVDALSGHEDGLLAIAEKLMEHYDSGYDVMGEAIIDAFADVQKLFQHVVEAAHMEGAAFEASRRQQEEAAAAEHPPATPSANGPVRHDEFIDQDVKDVLAEAIRQGTILRNENKDVECLRLFENACQDASSLLPVDSDHRGRLQLSIARAESMSPDRACAILRYAMDDVLRSGLKATPLPDQTQRADVVLNRPTPRHPTVSKVHQSSTEALASLSAELKEILEAPIYNDTPLQKVAERFWEALHESQKVQQKNEEKLEQNLAALKGEFLLARAEWEEKLNRANETLETYKSKYDKLRSRSGGDASFDHARSVNSDDNNTMYGSVKTAASRAETVASGMSGLALHARTLVMNSNFNCAGNSANNTAAAQSKEEAFKDMHIRYEKARPASRGRSQNNRSRSRSKNSRSFREYSRSPHRVDV